MTPDPIDAPGTPPAAGPALTAGGAVFARLARLGVDVVFVNSGTDFPPIIEGLAEADAHEAELPRTIVVAHEHAALSMAHGYYFATGRAQAVMLHTNVGLSNGATGAINAATDRVPMLLMSGRTPTVEEGRFGARTVPIGWGQEMRDQPALVREACKWDYELRFPEQVPQLLDRAHAIAGSTPRGPVYLALPREVLCEPCPSVELDRAPAMAAARVVAPPSLLTAVAEVLAEARRPLVIAQRGAGDQEGFDALARLADRWSIPVCQYWAVATAISAHHPMYVGQDPEPWISEADVVLVIDSLAPWSPDIHHLREDCRVIHLGPDPLEARFPVRNFRSDLSVTSEVGPGLVGLEQALSESSHAEADTGANGVAHASSSDTSPTAGTVSTVLPPPIPPGRSRRSGWRTSWDERSADGSPPWCPNWVVRSIRSSSPNTGRGARSRIPAASGGGCRVRWASSSPIPTGSRSPRSATVRTCSPTPSPATRWPRRTASPS